ncbi:MAG: segregation/condensation protein A [Salinivenus sp.]
MYRVELQQFEGPMDLLLFFIKRDEVDVYDIPIARIADEYLAYVRVLEEIDLDGVGDFIYMAALLINIKAQMLLPSTETDEEGEAVDPRRELVERLLEYVRFKEAADQLSTRREHRREHFTRGDASSQRENVQEDHDVEVDASVYDLVEALGEMLDESGEEDTDPVHEVEPLEHSVENQQEYVLNRLSDTTRVSFRALIRTRSKGFVIATFLAVLELARQHYLRIELDDTAGDFHLAEREEQPLHPEDPAFDELSAPSGDGAVQD